MNSSIDISLLHGLLERINTGIILVDADLNIRLWNQWVGVASRQPAEAVLGQPLACVMQLNDGHRLLLLVRQALQRGMSSVLSNRLHRHPLPLYQGRSGTAKPVEQQITVLPVRAGDDSRFCLIHVQDMSETAQRESLLRQSTQKLKKLSMAVEQSPNAVIITDINKVIEYVNPKFTALSGFESDEAVGRQLSEVCRCDYSDSNLPDQWQKLREGQEWRGESRIGRKNGELYWAEVHVAPIVADNGQATHLVFNLEDVTEVRHITEQMSYQARHDMLTGLVNRREFERLLNGAVDKAKAGSQHFVLFFSISISSRSSMTAVVMSPAMSCCGRSARCCASVCAASIPWRDSAVTSLWC